MDTTSTPTSGALAQRADAGTAIVWALLFVVVTAGMIVSHSILLSSQRRSSEVAFAKDSLAAAFSDSALREAQNWFRTQEVQPVAAFAPALDPTADPPRFETIDADIGLVREFELDRGLFGRYEVRREESADISAERGLPPGTLWELQVRSFIFRRIEAGALFGSRAVRVLAADTIRSELRSVRFVLPTLAALNIPSLADTDIKGDVLIRGGDAPGVASEVVTGVLGLPVLDLLPVALAPLVSGTPSDLQLELFPTSPLEVFGMSLPDLGDLADVALDERGRHQVLEIRDGIVVANQAHAEHHGLVVDNGVVAIAGELKLMPATTSKIAGLLYIDGDLTLQPNSHLVVAGSVVVRGTIRSGNNSSMEFHAAPEVMTRLADTLGRYRLPRTARP